MQRLRQGQHWPGHGLLEGLCKETPRFGGCNNSQPAEDAFTKLLANFEAQELPSTLHQSSTLTPFRRQRKSCRPLRIPPTSEISPASQDDEQKCLLKGPFPQEEHSAAPLEADKSESLLEMQDIRKPESLSTTPKDSHNMDKFLDIGMKLDCPLPTSVQENIWVLRNGTTSTTKSTFTSIKPLNGVVIHATGGLNPLPNPHQDDKTIDSFCSKVCRNGACHAAISSEASFCRRCSCCICKLFDNKKDPSLWIFCSPNVGGCGLSCHIECALKQQVAGVVMNLDGSIPSLDGSYFCHSCHAISPILGCWKEQLLVAKVAPTLHILHQRLLLSYRLLKGTKRYNDAHCPIEEAMTRVDAEVRQISKGSVKLLQCSVDTLPCKIDVQNLITLALEKAHTRHFASMEATKEAGDNVLPFVVCFEDISSSSIVIAVDARGAFVKPKLLGYKLWHRRANEPAYACAPTSILYNISAKFVVSNLHPLTDYTFKLVPFSRDGDLAACEAACSTKGVEHVEAPLDVYSSVGVLLINTEKVNGETSGCPRRVFDQDSHVAKGKNGLIIQDLDEVPLELTEHHMSVVPPNTGKELKNISEYPNRGAAVTGEKREHLALRYMAGVEEGRKLHSLDASRMRTGMSSSSMKTNCLVSPDCCDRLFSKRVKTAPKQDLHSDSKRCYHTTSSNHLCSLRGAALTSNILSPKASSQTWLWQGGKSEKVANANSTQTDKELLVHSLGDPMQGVFTCKSEADFNNYEFSVKVIRWLECKGHLKEEFRMKFLTWFTLRASEQEKSVISVFIDTLQDDPASLAGQLMDAFEEMIGISTHPSMLDGYCRRLW